MQMPRKRTISDALYGHTEAGKASRAKYLNSDKGKAMQKAKSARFRTTKKYRDWLKLNRSKPEVKLRLKQYGITWRATLKGNQILLWQSAKRHAKQKGLEFSICKEDIEIPTICPLLGITLVQGGADIWTSPSVDRKDSNKGYVKTNIWVISRRANLLKSDATVEELELILKNMKKYFLGGWRG
jgi:hypothetical protein